MTRPRNRRHRRNQAVRFLVVGWIEEIPGINCQERTREELIESLKVTLREALALNRRDAREAAGEDFEEAPIVI